MLRVYLGKQWHYSAQFKRVQVHFGCHPFSVMYCFS